MFFTTKATNDRTLRKPLQAATVVVQVKKAVTVVVGAPNLVLSDKTMMCRTSCKPHGVTEDATSWACGWRFAPCSVVQLVSKCKEDPDSLKLHNMKSVSTDVTHCENFCSPGLRSERLKDIRIRFLVKVVIIVFCSIPAAHGKVFAL